jgi:hypothetical protein
VIGEDDCGFRTFEEIKNIGRRQSAETWDDYRVGVAVGSGHPLAFQDDPFRVCGCIPWIGRTALHFEGARRTCRGTQAATQASFGFEGDRPIAAAQHTSRTGFTTKSTNSGRPTDDQAGVGGKEKRFALSQSFEPSDGAWKVGHAHPLPIRFDIDRTIGRLGS